jgi:hypothetical protein
LAGSELPVWRPREGRRHKIFTEERLADMRAQSATVTSKQYAEANDLSDNSVRTVASRYGIRFLREENKRKARREPPPDSTWGQAKRRLEDCTVAEVRPFLNLYRRELVSDPKLRGFFLAALLKMRPRYGALEKSILDNIIEDVEDLAEAVVEQPKSFFRPSLFEHSPEASKNFVTHARRLNAALTIPVSGEVLVLPREDATDLVYLAKLQLVRAGFEVHGNDNAAVARMLGIAPRTLRMWLEAIENGERI